MKNNLTRGYSMALLSALILSTTAIFIRHLTQTYALPALVLAFWRDIFVVLALLPALLLVAPSLIRIDPGHLPFLIGYGLILSIFNSLWTLSVAWNGAAVATVLVYCSAGFTVLLGWWLLRETLTWAKLLAVVICLCGCTLVSEAFAPSAWHSNLVGILTGIFSGLSYAAYSLMGRSAAQRGLSPWTSLLYTFSFAALFLLVCNLLPEGILPGTASQPVDLFWLGNSLSGWGFLILLAAGPTVLGFGLYNVSLSHLPSSIVNLVVTLEPAFTTITAYLLLGERLNAVQLTGSLIILAGVVLLRIYDGRTIPRVQPRQVQA